MSTTLSSFEHYYLDVRQKESRVYSNEKVAQLPYLTKTDPHYLEWKLRAKTLERFLPYLERNHTNHNLLEIGCGNGWFSHQCSNYTSNVIGIDVNQTELEQAKVVFNKENLSFRYWDIFTQSPFNQQFDCIVLNAVIQYFPNFDLLMTRLKELLSEKGEVHILDSPFYLPHEVNAAKKRTEEYYLKMNVPEMAQHYYHHTINAISEFECLHQPSANKLSRLLKGKDSPFSWFRWQS